MDIGTTDKSLPSYAVPRPIHIPVLLHEVVTYLDPKPGQFVIDGTFGGGGYAEAILTRLAPRGRFLGFDLDIGAVLAGGPRIRTSEKQGVEITLVNENFAELPEFLARHEYGKADGLVLDLGFSSDQLEKSGRGFSFLRNEPLLMTYDPGVESVRDILIRIDEDTLAHIIVDFGEERYARRIAHAIKERGSRTPLRTTGELAQAIAAAVPKGYEHGRIHPATRTFLALRVYANHELENLERILSSLAAIVRGGGRVCIVSFHSLEDRLVKTYCAKLVKADQAALLTKKPVRPDGAEAERNPRARSAKLRVIQLIA